MIANNLISYFTNYPVQVRGVPFRVFIFIVMKENENLAKILVLYDIINQYTFELKPELKHHLKMLTNNADKALSLLIKEIDKMFPNKSDDFGSDADFLRELIDNQYKLCDGKISNKNTLPDISIEEAEILSLKSDYACFAVESEGNEINTADASSFFLEGYCEAQRRLKI